MVEFERSPGGRYHLVERDSEDEAIFAEIRMIDDAWDQTLEMLGRAQAPDEPDEPDEPEPPNYSRTRQQRRRRRRDCEGPSVPKKAKVDANENAADENAADENAADENAADENMEVDIADTDVKIKDKNNAVDSATPNV